MKWGKEKRKGAVRSECLHPSKILMLKLTLCGDGVASWGLWEVVRS